MSSTKTYTENLQDALNTGNPTFLGDLLRKMQLGNMLSPVKVVVTGLAATQAVVITGAAVFAAATVTGLPTASTDEGQLVPTTLPPILSVRTLRVTASGTGGSLGAYIVTDAGGTAIVPPGGASAAVGVALLSDDGTTITFPNTVTGFVLEYTPRSAVDLQTAYAGP